MSYSYTTSTTFTLTHAKRLAAKVVADMYQSAQIYRHLTDAQIVAYQQELEVLITGGYIDTYEFGFKRDGLRVVSWHYTVGASGDLEGGRAGGINAVANISGAVTFNFLNPSNAWNSLTDAQRAAVTGQHTIRRISGSAPSDGYGRWISDRTYGSGGVLIERKQYVS